MESAAPGAKPGRWMNLAWRLALAFLILTLLCGALVHFTNGVYPYDDGYIIYRYVDNLFAGKGLVYNSGTRVFGTSTPLYVFWLILLKTFARSVATPDLAARMNFVFYLASGVGMFFLLLRLVRSRWLAAVIAGLFVLRHSMVYASTGGMESLLFTACVLWSLWALSTRRFILGGTIAGLSVLVRPEGLFLAGIVLAAWLIADRQRPLAVITGLLVPGVVWLIFGYAYYGTPIYHSIIAKAAPLYPLPFGAALRGIWKEISSWTTAGLCGKSLFLAIPLLSLAGLGYVFRHRLLKIRGTGAWPVLAMFGVLVLFYFVSNPMMFAWYYPVLETLWFMYFVVGVVWFGSWLGRKIRWLRWIVIGIVALFLGYPALKAPVNQVFAGKSVFQLGIEKDAVRMRTRAYRDAALWINVVVPDGIALAGPEIGSLGYYYKGPVIDACGLVSPEALPFLPVPAEEKFDPNCGAISLKLVQKLLPGVIVSIGTLAGLSLYDSDWFWENYIQVKQFSFPHEVWGSKTVDVFFHRYHVKYAE